MKDIEKIGINSADMQFEAKVCKPGNSRSKPFKKLILTIWGNSEFGCELA
jgi:hypothetical protein